MYNRKEADARYRNKDRAAFNARVRKCKKKYKKEYKEKNKKYRKTHTEEIRLSSAVYRANNKAWIKQRDAEYYKAHPEDYKERLNNWRKENPERAKIQTHTRRTRKTQAGGSFTTEEWKALCKKYGNKCLCCGRRRKLIPDHVISVVNGGTSNIGNIQPLCQPCNSRKSTHNTDYRKKALLNRRAFSLEDSA